MWRNDENLDNEEPIGSKSNIEQGVSSSNTLTLTLKILSGMNIRIPKNQNLSIYVCLVLKSSLSATTASETLIGTTECISYNHINPYWNKEFTIKIENPEQNYLIF